MGLLTGNRARRTTKRAERAKPTFHLVCYLDRLPPHLPELEGFRQLSGNAPEVECILEADDFAEAVAEAIRTLEGEFVHVQALERIGLHGLRTEL